MPRFDQYLASEDVKLELQIKEKFYDLPPLDPATCLGAHCWDKNCKRHYDLKIESGIHQAELDSGKLKSIVDDLLRS